MKMADTTAETNKARASQCEREEKRREEKRRPRLDQWESKTINQMEIKETVEGEEERQGGVCIGTNVKGNERAREKQNPNYSYTYGVHIVQT